MKERGSTCLSDTYLVLKASTAVMAIIIDNLDQACLRFGQPPSTLLSLSH